MPLKHRGDGCLGNFFYFFQSCSVSTFGGCLRASSASTSNYPSAIHYIHKPHLRSFSFLPAWHLHLCPVYPLFLLCTSPNQPCLAPLTLSVQLVLTRNYNIYDHCNYVLFYIRANVFLFRV